LNVHRNRARVRSELSELLVRHGEIVGASATSFLTAQHDSALDAASPGERDQVLRWELELCREPGALDGRTHILAVLGPFRDPLIRHLAATPRGRAADSTNQAPGAR
jgi:hypothetical protein